MSEIVEKVFNKLDAVREICSRQDVAIEVLKGESKRNRQDIDELKKDMKGMSAMVVKLSTTIAIAGSIAAFLAQRYL